MDDEYAELFKKLPPRPSADTSWQAVAAEFEALGRSFGDILRGARQRQDNDAGLRRLRESLESMVQEVNRTVEGTPEARQALEQLDRLAESIRGAAERAGDEVRPELLSLLRSANAELRRMGHLDD